jgi:hypothetical protein
VEPVFLSTGTHTRWQLTPASACSYSVVRGVKREATPGPCQRVAAK